VEPRALPVEGVIDDQRRHPGRGSNALEKAESRLAQQPRLHGAAPDPGGLFSPLLAAVGGEGIGDALGGPHGVLMPEVERIHHRRDAAGHGGRQFDARQPGDGEEPLVGDHPGLSLAAGSGLALGRSETVGPPVRPGGAQHGQGFAAAGGQMVEKFAGRGAAQPRPEILCIPGGDHLRGQGRGGRIVSKVATELQRERVMRIALLLETAQIDRE